MKVALTASQSGNSSNSPSNGNQNGMQAVDSSNATNGGTNVSNGTNNSRNSDRHSPTCYNCGHLGHISTFCPEPGCDKRATSAANVSCYQDAPVYLNVPTSPTLDIVELMREERVDESDKVFVGHQEFDIPLYHILTQVQERREVFAFSTPATDTLHTPSTVMHSFTKTLGGENLFTISDTAALLNLVPMSTVTALNLAYIPGSDMSFIVPNGSRMAPVSYCNIMQFFFPEDPNRVFADKVYVVDNAPFQLLLGVRFLHKYWAGIFLPCAKMVLLKPYRVEVQGSLVRPSAAQPLHSESIDNLRLAEVDNTDNISTLVTIPMAKGTLKIGKHDLVAELDGPILNDFATIPAEARISRDFVQGIFQFGPSCPPVVIEKAIDLIVSHWDQFS